MDYLNTAQDKAFQVSYKLEAIAYLLTNIKIEGQGLRDTEAHHGLGMILEDLSKTSREINLMLDSVHRNKLNDKSDYNEKLHQH